MSGKKRTKTKEPENKQGDRRSHTEGGVDIGKSSSSSASTEVRAAISLPFQVTVANKASSIIKFIEKLKASNKEKMTTSIQSSLILVLLCSDFPLYVPVLIGIL